MAAHAACRRRRLLTRGCCGSARSPRRRRRRAAAAVGVVQRRPVVGRAPRRLDARRLRRVDDPRWPAPAREGRRARRPDPPAGRAGDPQDAAARGCIDRGRAAIGRTRGCHPPRPAARRRLAVADPALLRAPPAIRDNVHNGIFVVDGADRRRIDDESRSPGPHGPRLASGPTGPHRVDRPPRGVRRRRDDADHDRHRPAIPSGRLGVGSFDDAGAFRGIRVQGAPAAP